LRAAGLAGKPGLRVIKAPIPAPRAKAHAERWVGSVRREHLDRILIVFRRQLETVLREYVAYYNTHRPHRSLEQQPPVIKTLPISAADREWRVRRRDRLGGLLHEYELAALGPIAIFELATRGPGRHVPEAHAHAVAGRGSIDLRGPKRIGHPTSRLTPSGLRRTEFLGPHRLPRVWERDDRDRLWSRG
jgi:Integrase core domain